MLDVKNLTFSYEGKRKKHCVFENLTLSFRRGFNVILGPNGAGKSTLLQCMFGLLPAQGSVLYEGTDFTKLSLHKRIDLMSYLPQNDYEQSTLTVFEMVLLGRIPELTNRISDEDATAVMETLSELNLEYAVSRKVCELSGGQQKLVAIAQTLVRRPSMILMDEPTNSLDLQKQLELCDLLGRIVDQRKIGLVLALHDLNLAARYAENIVVLTAQGEIYGSGTPAEIVTERMLREVYGVDARVTLQHDGTPSVFAIASVRG